MKRVVLYCQSSTGIGHIVRTARIARALAARHDVTLLSGGRPFPGSRPPPPAVTVELPPLHREGKGGLRSSGDDAALSRVLEARAAAIREAVLRARPEVLITEHFPFSRWSLRAEIEGAIAAAREAHPAVKVVCSLRDIARKSTFDTWEGAASLDAATLDSRYGDEVVPALARDYDALLVHGDPTVTRLEEQIGWAARIPVPVTYTGYVSEEGKGSATGDAAAAAEARERAEIEALGPFAMIHSGGGAELSSLLGPALEAWALLRSQGRAGGRALVAFASPFEGEEGLRALASRAGAGAVVRPFTPRVGAWLSAADASLSRAGYNTCVEVLRARARAVLVPSAKMVDQPIRASRLAALGCVTSIAPGEATPARLADALAETFARERPSHAIALDGAARTLAFVDGL